MLHIALRTVQARWQLFLGTFVALTFAIAVMAGMFNVMISASQNRPLQGSPARYDAATIIIESDQELNTRQPDGSEQRIALTDRKPLPAKIAKAVAGIPGTAQVVIDRSFSATIASNPNANNPANRQTGHGWQSAQLTPFHLTAGQTPQAGQIVITEATANRAGIAVHDTVSVVTPTGPQQFNVSGIADTPYGDGLPGEDTLFFNDEQAAELSGRPDKVSAIGIIAASGTDTGQLQRRVASALPDSSLKIQTDENKGGNVAAELYNTAVQPAIELTGFNISTAGFICIFVVAATASFSIAQRRQEIALLRLVGATPKQIRRMVLSETLVVALAAIAVGSALGALLGTLFAALLRNYGMAPADFTVGVTWLGMLLASAIGVVVALIGVFLASRRAGKVRAAEAMRDAVAEQRVMTFGRWAAGIFFLLAASVLVFLMTTLSGFAAIAIAVFVTQLFAVALALLMPAFIKPVISLITTPLVGRTTAVGMLARANLRGAARRTASTAAPILVAVSITISLVGASVLGSDGNRINTEQRTLASYIMTTQANGIPEESIQALRQTPGVETVAGTPAVMFYVGNDLTTQDTMGIMDDSIASVFDVDVTEGSLRNLGNNGVVVTILKAQEMGWHVGETVPIFLGDGTKASIRIAAIANMPVVIPEILAVPEVLRSHIAPPMVPQAFIKTNPDANSRTLQHRLQETAGTVGAQVQSKQTWLEANKANAQRDSQIGLTMLLGLTLVYLAIAIANTLLMAISARAKDISLLRNAGASRRQILGMIAWESIVAVAAASFLAILAASLTVFGVYNAVSEIVPAVPFPLIQPAYFAVIGASLVIALLASVLPAIQLLRSRGKVTEE